MTQDGISSVPREARAYQGDRAGVVTRLVAAAVDALSVAAALATAYAGLNVALFLINPRDFEFARVPAFVDVTTALLVCVLYLAGAWSITGRTYGDHVMGLRVVTDRGRRVRALRALVRAVLCVGFPIGLLWCAVSTSRRSMQDAVVRTAVIYDWRPRREVEAVVSSSQVSERTKEDGKSLAVATHRLDVVNVVAAVSFTIGGSLFALGAFFAQQDIGATAATNITYLVGGVFFSLGGYSSIVLVNLHTDTGRIRWWSNGSGGLAWRSAVVLFVGSLFFAISLVAAFAEALTPRQSNGWIWFPDMIGCVCFLVSGHLAMLDVCGGRVGVRLRDGGWWIVAINQLGSVLFFLAGLASFVRPATSEDINAGLVNWGTFAGAVCFAVAGLVQVGRGADDEAMLESRDDQHQQAE